MLSSIDLVKGKFIYVKEKFAEDLKIKDKNLENFVNESNEKYNCLFNEKLEIEEDFQNFKKISEKEK